MIALLLTTVIGTTIWALQLSSAVAVMSANAASVAARHRKEISSAVARTKAKARLRRIVAVVPFVGAGAVVYFEEQDYREWLEENPQGSRADYACEVAQLSAEVIDEVLLELPELMRPQPDAILAWMPTCTASPGTAYEAAE